MIVADTNLIAYLLLDGEHTTTAEQVLDSDSHWIAPLLWRSEFRNVLALYLSEKLLTLEQAVRFLEFSEILMEGREYTLASEAILELATNSGCSAYDCEFVALARRKGIPLVTSDRRVLKAFPKIAIHPRSFID